MSKSHLFFVFTVAYTSGVYDTVVFQPEREATFLVHGTIKDLRILKDTVNCKLSQRPDWEGQIVGEWVHSVPDLRPPGFEASLRFGML